MVTGAVPPVTEPSNSSSDCIGFFVIPLPASTFRGMHAFTSAGHRSVNPVQNSAGSHFLSLLEARHCTFDPFLTSTGQVFSAPLQYSGMSQKPAAGAQSVTSEDTASAGHAAFVPSHTSRTSHGPPAARHTVPAARGAPFNQHPPVMVQEPAWQSPAFCPTVQANPFACSVFAGQFAALPGQLSATSH